MNLIIKSQKTKVTAALKEYATKKFKKLTTYFEHIQEIIIELNVTQNKSSEESYCVSSVLKVSKGVLKAEESASDMYAALDNLYLKVQNQLKKHKEKMKSTKIGAGKIIPLLKSKKKIKVKKSPEQEPHYIQKPMDIEDAELYLSEKKLPFLVFKNMKEKTCVVYPISGKEYGLIEVS